MLFDPSSNIIETQSDLADHWMYVHVSYFGLYNGICSTVTPDVSRQPSLIRNYDKPPLEQLTK